MATHLRSAIWKQFLTSDRMILSLKRCSASLMNARELAEAATAYEQAVKLNPQLLSATARLAELNAGPLRAAAKALDFAKKARELAPNDPKIVGILGIAAYQTGNYKWAYSLLLESARKLPDDREILYNLAWAVGKVDEAEHSMQRSSL